MEDKEDMVEEGMGNLLTIAMVDKRGRMDVLKAAALLVLPLYAVAVYATC